MCHGYPGKPYSSSNRNTIMRHVGVDCWGLHAVWDVGVDTRRSCCHHLSRLVEWVGPRRPTNSQFLRPLPPYLPQSSSCQGPPTALPNSSSPCCIVAPQPYPPTVQPEAHNCTGPLQEAVAPRPLQANLLLQKTPIF
ncbi:hypothetical protein P153DRAFT_127525 [Dothidotthia symphoricarpi CBS 119687]|uniref:Uncharacterized protein n=1 Tax=Dothidotthia symphoricarpi CBS 119687 TaxID=1392245 RepID=A0A6A6A0X7_9PLEO|nr:uncharacterized protein P153DRAFT_127525 [Dothidotthia symphoricarpi CBS 119687]KAF2124804.1 hypothetical protein P153DRAFT_127525 [Dothidotthia symphoricarpi CBS 119687]